MTTGLAHFLIFCPFWGAPGDADAMPVGEDKTMFADLSDPENLSPMVELSRTDRKGIRRALGTNEIYDTN